MMEPCCSRFTAAEGGARLAVAAGKQNTLAVEYASFISTRLIYEEAYKIRGFLSDGRQRSVHVARESRVRCVAYEIDIMTDLSTVQAINYADVYDWNAELENKEVLICTAEVFKQLLEETIIKMSDVNVLVIDSCHRVCKDVNLRYIMSIYKECDEKLRPRILALTYPLFMNKKEAETQNLNENNQAINETIDDVSEEVDSNCFNEEVGTTCKEAKMTELKEDLAVVVGDSNGVKTGNDETFDDCSKEIVTNGDSVDDNEDSTFSKAVKIEDLTNDTDNNLSGPKIEKIDKRDDDTKEDEVKITEITDSTNIELKHDVNIDSNESKVKREKDIGEYENLDDFDMYEKLEWKIGELEKELCSRMDFAEDIDGGKRVSASMTKPKELVIEYSFKQSEDNLSKEYIDLDKYMRETVQDAIGFLEDHRHDPTEIYGEELYEEFKNIPDPSVDPKNIFRQFLYILDQLGPYAADKAAFSLLITLEKLKIKVPYERHFLLLCLCTSVFVKIRCYADIIFSKQKTEWESIKLYSTPKVIRLAEILEKFRPPDNQRNDTERNKEGFNAQKLLGDIDKCDFASLGDRIEDKMNTYTANLKDLELESDMLKSPNTQDAQNTPMGPQKVLVPSRRQGHRTRGRGRLMRNNASRIQQLQQNPDALCGIVFLKEPLMAKIMFILIVEMSRCHPKLSYLCAQYCAVEHVEEPRESQRQGKKREEVLKKFRMHECNLLLATPALEEGIDLPRCNLVLRWDVPPSYRSYGLCRGRARASRSASALLCSDTHTQVDMLLHNLATYRELDQVISRKCGCGIQDEPSQAEEDYADTFTSVIKPYRPLEIINSKENEGTRLLESVETNSKTSLDSDNTFTSDINTDLPVGTINIKKNADTIRIRTKDETVKKTNFETTSNNVINDDATQLDNDFSKEIIISTDNDITVGVDDGSKILVKLDNKLETVEVTDRSIKEIEKIDIYLQEEMIQIANKEDESVENKIISSKNEVTDICKEFEDLIINNDIEVSENLKKTGENEKSQIDKDVVKAVLNVDEKLFCNKCNIKTDNEECIYVLKEEINDSNDGISESTDRINSRYCEISTSSGRINPDACRIRKIIDDINPKDFRINKNDRINSENYENKDSTNRIITCDCRIKKSAEDITSVSNGINDCLSEISDFKLSVSDKLSISTSGISCDVSGISDTGIRSSVDRIRYDVKNDDGVASVDLSTAIALINRYCGKLPSDTFTRLAPQWWIEEVQLPTQDGNRTAYIYTLRLPLNCPIKYNIVGHPMPTRVLARRMVALQACRILHKSGELDDQLMPIGKENFKTAEMDMTNLCTNENETNDSARPGTTKRRQYYYKRTASAFTDCQPVVDASDSEIQDPQGGGIGRSINIDCNSEAKRGVKRNMLYAIVCRLWCGLPERYNTRGRRLHAPQTASQAIGILMARTQPDSLQIPAFPVYTRSGEVRVSVELVPDADVRMSPRRGRLVRRFMRFVFAEVLRVRRRGMKLQSEGSTHNNYYIVPTIKTTREDGTSKIDIDWAFLELIYQHTEQKKQTEIEKPILWQHQDEEDDDEELAKEDIEKSKEEGSVKKIENPLLKSGETFVFDPEKYKEAVVTPWYRNQDQPQFFLVAEICWNLTPDSAFPSASHSSFRDYYHSKYGATLTQAEQPLLDVDHTSARLNLLTPRYVNRKGVALPVSSERTRRAKRDRLDQKQILVPELTRVHPFAAPLWFATVALPCVLYRINALLIADEIRRAVAIDVGLGVPKIDEATIPGFQWPPLDFGWSLAEVLSADSTKTDKKKDAEESRKELKEKEKVDQEETEKEDSQKQQEEPKEKTLNDILQEKEDAEGGFEIGTWSNDMASSIPESDYDEFMEPLPPNVTFCTSAAGGANWCDPIERPKRDFNNSRMYNMADSDCSYMSSDFDTDDSDLETDVSDEDTDTSGFWSSKNSNSTMGVRIEYKTAHEAEAVDIERKTKVNPAPEPDEVDDHLDRCEYDKFMKSGKPPKQHVDKFRSSIAKHREDIKSKGLIKSLQPIRDMLPDTSSHKPLKRISLDSEIINAFFPYGSEEIELSNGQVTVESVEKNKQSLLTVLRKNLPDEELGKLNCFSMREGSCEKSGNVVNVEKNKKSSINILGNNLSDEAVETQSRFSLKESENASKVECKDRPYYKDGGEKSGAWFDFDHQPNLEGHPGPSPSVILQALTMSNANDGINLERLETIGDSFLKFAITAYLYCAQPNVHEGKLSHMRSKQVSNLNLYRLGRNKRLGARMIASKFEPHDNWLPPCYKAPPTLHPRFAGLSELREQSNHTAEASLENTGCFIPYNLITQHSIPDKSIADCVEALIGAYLLECGPRGALLFMSWLGIRVLPQCDLPCDSCPDTEDIHQDLEVDVQAKSEEKPNPESSKPDRHSSTSSECSSDDEEQPQQLEESDPVEEWWWKNRRVGSLRPYRDENGRWMQSVFGELKPPPSPLLRYIDNPDGELEHMLSGYDALERTLEYRFKDRSLLLQAMTHASHHKNRLTDCYQRLEFLGDAILDYLITRHLYEDPRRHCPGALTDLRSALVNNTIFATLAARHGFHKYFRHMSPGLNEVLTKYVKIQEENGHSISEEHYLIQEDEMEQAEDVEVPKALGDLFESVAGAIFLDSGMSLGAVWKSYVKLMGKELEAFSAAAPKSPVRELLEAEPDTAKFGKPERLADGRRVRVCVEVFGRGAFKGIGRNYRIAKGTAARCALRHLRLHKR